MLLAWLAGPNLTYTVVETIPAPAGLRRIWCDADPTVLLAHTDQGLERYDGTWTVVEPDILHSGELHGGGAAWVRWQDGTRQIGATDLSGETIWTAEIERITATWTGVAIKRTDVPLTIVQLHTQTPRVFQGQAEFRVPQYGDTYPRISPDGTQILLAGPFYLGVVDVATGTTDVLEDSYATRHSAWGPRGALWSGDGGDERTVRYGLDRRSWTRTLDNDVQSVIWLDDPGLWIITTQDGLHALDPRSGETVPWRSGPMASRKASVEHGSQGVATCGSDTVLVRGDALELWQIERTR